MNFPQLTSVLSAMAVLSVLPGMTLAAQEKSAQQQASAAAAVAEANVPLKYAKDQYKACYKAKINWEGDSLVLRTDTAEWDSGVRINPPKGEKYLDLSKGKVLAVDVQNLSDKNQLRLTMHISTGSRKEKNFREAYTGIGLNPGEKRSQNKNAKQDSHSILTYLGSCIQKKCISHTVQHLFKACFFLPSKIHGSKQYRYQNSRIGRSLGTERKNIETKRPSCHSKEASYQRCGNIQILKLV